MRTFFCRALPGVLAAAGLAAALAAGPQPARAADPMFDDLHFLVPGGAGGGWDTTARTTGRVLQQTGLLGNASYENMSGAGGGKAIGYMIETAERQRDTLMVNSTPIIVRSITKVFPYSFRDLTPVASIIADYSVIAVRADSDYDSFADLVSAFEADPQAVKIAGGSVRGDLDHLAAASAMKAAGGNPRDVAYIPYDAGGKALAGLLSGETDAISTGLGEVITPHKEGQLRILAIAAPEPIDALPDVPTFKELGYDHVFANWRGFFASPAVSEERAQRYADMLKRMQQTDRWQEAKEKRGWVNLYQPRAEFVSFLENQEAQMRSLMKDLGFL
jgi:putative tricarboxylic transport membrane protein